MASLTLLQFRVKMFKLSIRFPERADEIKRKAALQALSQVTLATPVDKGRARANWLVGRGSPITSENEVFLAGKEGSTGGLVAQETISKGKVKLEKPAEGLPIYLSNNLIYIKYLNQGSSVQAPKRFIESAVKAAVRSILDSKIIEDKR